MASPRTSIPYDAPKLPPLTALRTLALVGRFLRPYRRQVVFAGIALLFAAGAVLTIGQGLKFVIDRGFGAGSGPELDRALAFCLAVVFVMAIATYARFYFVSWLGERVTADLRRAVFDHLLRLPPGYFEVMRTGEVISRLTNDTTMLETVIGSSASMAIRNVLLMVGGLVMLALTSAKLTLLVLVGVPLVLVPIIFFGRRVRRLARASQDRVGDVGAYVDEALHEIRTVQAYGHEEEDRRQFGARVGGRVRYGAAAHPPACVPGRDGHRARVRRRRRHPVDRRPRRRRRTHQRGRTLGIRVLRSHRGERGRYDQRSDRRSAASGRGDRAPVRAAGDRARRFVPRRIRRPLPIAGARHRDLRRR